MIPVSRQPEPTDFDVKVRQPGQNWLAKHNIQHDSALPAGTVLKEYWTKALKQLWEAYGGICAYLAIYIEFSAGAVTTDHFFPKSKYPGMAYEWNNYRLASLAANRDKHEHEDVLDPFEIEQGTFTIEFSSGAILPDIGLSVDVRESAIKTIERLKLDSAENRQMRVRHFNSYISGECTLGFLQRESPFVYAEIIRQKMELEKQN